MQRAAGIAEHECRATVESPPENGEAAGACRDGEDSEVILANALKRMVDEVVGECRFVWANRVQWRR